MLVVLHDYVEKRGRKEASRKNKATIVAGLAPCLNGTNLYPLYTSINVKGCPMKFGAPFTVAIAAAAILLAPRAQAETFDGTWQAVGEAQSMQCPGVNAHFTVRGDGFGSTVGVAKFTYGFRGKIAPDGSFDVKSPGGTAHISGKFSGNDVTVQFEDNRCPSARPLTGKKIG
jgi:hypothetical protein